MRLLSKNGRFFVIDGKAIGERSIVSRTWYLNDTIDDSTYVSFDVNFLSNGKYFRRIVCIGLPELDYYPYNSDDATAHPYDNGVWNEPAYRTITFDVPPSGDLLTWLQANGTPRGGGYWSN